MARQINSKNSIEVQCSECGNSFLMLKLRYNERKKNRPNATMYCNKECLSAGKSKIQSKLKSELALSKGSRLITNCHTCNKEIELIKFNLKERNFCCNACCIDYMAQRNREKVCPDPLEKWLASVDKTPGQGPNGDCWIWTGKFRGFNGVAGEYGYFHWPRVRLMGAHVAGYSLFTGDMNTHGFEICHKCDNPPCVNPAHLFKGTGKDNQIDANNKDRRKVGAKSFKAKLSEAQVLEIRDRYAKGGETYASLAVEFGLYPTSIGRIIKGKTYYKLYGDS